MIRLIRKIKIMLIKFWFMYMPKFLCYCREAGFARREWFCYKYLKKHISWADSVWDEMNCKPGLADTVVPNKTIFVYWRQGFGSAPPLVKRCLESVRRNAGCFQVLLLTEKNLNGYLCLPSHIVKRHDEGLIGEAHFSDLVRANLLYLYGGIWMDATCFLSAPIEEYVTNSRFFMFQNTKLGGISPIKCSNWFIKAEVGSLLLKRVLNFLFMYYSKYDVTIHYYLFHLVLSLLVEEDDNLKDEWVAMPYVCNMNPHVFLFSLDVPFSEKQYENILRSCFVHKLTYKYSPSLLDSSGENMLQHFLRG